MLTIHFVFGFLSFIFIFVGPFGDIVCTFEFYFYKQPEVCFTWLFESSFFIVCLKSFIIRYHHHHHRHVWCFALWLIWCVFFQLKVGPMWSCGRSSSSQKEPLRWWPVSATEAADLGHLREERHQTDPCPVRAVRSQQTQLRRELPRWEAALWCFSFRIMRPHLFDLFVFIIWLFLNFVLHQFLHLDFFVFSFWFMNPFVCVFDLPLFPRLPNT